MKSSKCLYVPSAIWIYDNEKRQNEDAEEREELEVGKKNKAKHRVQDYCVICYAYAIHI